MLGRCMFSTYKGQRSERRRRPAERGAPRATASLDAREYRADIKRKERPVYSSRQGLVRRSSDYSCLSGRRAGRGQWNESGRRDRKVLNMDLQGEIPKKGGMEKEKYL